MQVPEILTAPRSPVAKLVVNLCVAGLAEGHQIVIPMRPALRKRDDVMDLLHRSQPSFLQAHLTQGMRRSIAVADSLPSPAVLLVAVSGASVPVVLSAGGSFMFLTVLPVREVWTAGVGAGAFWFLWHAAPRFPGKRKALQDCSRKARSLSCFSDSNYITGTRCIAVAFSGLFRKRRPTPCGGAGTAIEAHSPYPRRSAPRT